MMKLAHTAVAAAVLALGATAGLAEDKKAEKPVITCKEIVEVYKVNKSVDETSSRMLVDQSRVASCLKEAGIAMPNQDNQ